MRGLGVRFPPPAPEIVRTRQVNIEKIKKLYLDEKYSVKEIADRLDLSFWKVYDMMKRNDIPRRNPSEASYVSSDRLKPKFLIKRNVDLRGESLKIAGLMLYWAEGAKNGSTVDFANSDSQMIKFFLRFLREICGIAENRIRIYLYAFSDQNVSELQKYWSRITQVPIVQFTKPYIRKVNSALKNRRMPYGLIHIRYNDTRLLKCIKIWLSEYIESFSEGQVAERSNAPDCLKAASRLKAR